MSNPAHIMAQLAAPFPPSQVSWRVGATTQDKSKGMALAYIDARDVMDRLDTVCGSGWQSDYIPIPGGSYCCKIGILIDGQWVWRANGAGETAMEADKGGYSDAFKRAGVQWGIGRYLYSIDSPWVQLEGSGKFVKIKPSELTKLRNRLPGIDGTPHKNPPREDRRDAFRQLSDKLRSCQTLEAVDVLLDEEAQLIADIPDAWKSNWNTAVQEVRMVIRERQKEAA